MGQITVELNSAIAFISGFPLLAGIDLQVSEGEIVMVTGPNGSGKSSLLRVLASLIRLSSGSGQILGQDIGEPSLLSGPIGFLGHNLPLYFDLSAIENVKYSLQGAQKWIYKVENIQKSSKKEAKKLLNERAQLALTMMGVSPKKMQTKVSNLSQGQMKRVALAPLFSKNPYLLLLDEVHAGLDSIAREIINNLILECAANGCTVLFTSHELIVGETIANRVIELRGGMVFKDDSVVP